MKIVLVLLALPFVAVLALLLVSLAPFVLIYFIWSRLLSCVEHFKPVKNAVKKDNAVSSLLSAVLASRPK